MFRVRTNWVSPVGGPYVSTMHFIENVGGQADADAFAAAVATFWGAVDGELDANVSWALDQDVTEHDPTTGALENVYGVAAAGASGSLAGDMLPAASQALVRWRTSNVVGTQILQGRTFIPGISESNLLEGRLGTTTRTQILNAANTLIANSTLAIWHRPTPPAADGVIHTVTSASVWNEFAVLTSRRD